LNFVRNLLGVYFISGPFQGLGVKRRKKRRTTKRRKETDYFFQLSNLKSILPIFIFQFSLLSLLSL
jgi:hypothetical protein